jgi:hypothetical protein
MPSQFVPSPKNRTPRRGGSRVPRTGREESGPLRGPRQIAARAMYKIPPRTSSAPSPIRNILGLSIYRCHAVAPCVFSGSTGSNWRSSMRRGPSGRRRNPPPTCLKLLPRLGQLTLGARVRRSSRSVWSGFRPDMSEGAWRPPCGWPFNPLLPKQFLVHARDHALQSGCIWTRRGEGAGHAGGSFVEPFPAVGKHITAGDLMAPAPIRNAAERLYCVRAALCLKVFARALLDRS